MLHIITFLKSINTSLSNCLLKDGTIDFMKICFQNSSFDVFLGALVNTYQINSCSVFLAKCFADSEFLWTSLCSSHLILQSLIVSPTCFSPHEQLPFLITQLRC